MTYIPELGIIAVLAKLGFTCYYYFTTKRQTPNGNMKVPTTKVTNYRPPNIEAVTIQLKENNKSLQPFNNSTNDTDL